MTLVDTDVLIWYMHGNENAKNKIESINGFYISAVTYMELVQGMRNKKELTTLRSALRKWGVEIIFINEDISAKAMFMVEQHYLSSSVEMADALIAATAVTKGLSLLTGNTKHYKVISNLELSEFRP